MIISQSSLETNLKQLLLEVDFGKIQLWIRVCSKSIAAELLEMTFGQAERTETCP